jgi:hypothetical protein
MRAVARAIFLADICYAKSSHTHATEVPQAHASSKSVCHLMTTNAGSILLDGYSFGDTFRKIAVQVDP